MGAPEGPGKEQTEETELRGRVAQPSGEASSVVPQAGLWQTEPTDVWETKISTTAATDPYQIMTEEQGGGGGLRILYLSA